MAITTWETAKAWWPGLPEAEVQPKWRAAEAYVATRTTWTGADEEPPAPAPAELIEAVRLMTARLLQRRNSPEGVVGMDADGLGAVRVPREDVDVQALINPYRLAVIA